jgi:hypothetical protein
MEVKEMGGVCTGYMEQGPVGIFCEHCNADICFIKGGGRLGGVMVSVLTIGPKVRGVKPDRGDGFLRAIKICSTPSFVEEVKPEPHVVRLYGILKITCMYEQKYFVRPNSSFLSPVPPAYYQMTAGRISRELWWANQDFSSVSIIPPWFSILMSPGG